MLNMILTVLVSAIPVIAAITLHEAAHGYAALALGDDTARTQGRLSLNPLRHVDPVGTLLLPGFLIVSQMLSFGRVLFMFGWAKPVPVSAWRFRRPRQYMALVAAAGPAMNFFLAWLSALALRQVDVMPGQVGDVLDAGLNLFMLSNLVLGLFNLLPIPPLDGGRIAVGLLPARLAFAWAKLERAGIVIVLLGVFLLPRLLASFGIAFDPVHRALGYVLPHALDLLNHAAGRSV